MPQGLCSSANVFTCYCSLIDQIVPKDITLNGFADDHSLRKSFPAGNRTQEQQVKHRMELTFSDIKEWMDSMCPKLKLRKNSISLWKSIFSGTEQFFLEHKLSPVHLTWLHLVYVKILFLARHPHLMVYVECFFLYNIILDNCQKAIFVNFLLTNGKSTVNV